MSDNSATRRRDRQYENYFLCSSVVRAYMRGDLAWLRSRGLGLGLPPSTIAETAMGVLQSLTVVECVAIRHRALYAVASLDLAQAGTKANAVDLTRPRAAVLPFRRKVLSFPPRGEKIA